MWKIWNWPRCKTDGIENNIDVSLSNENFIDLKNGFENGRFLSTKAIFRSISMSKS